jgi:hypothetical protein
MRSLALLTIALLLLAGAGCNNSANARRDDNRDPGVHIQAPGVSVHVVDPDKEMLK